MQAPPPTQGFSNYPRGSIYGSATKLRLLQNAQNMSYLLVAGALFGSAVGQILMLASGSDEVGVKLGLVFGSMTLLPISSSRSSSPG